MSAACETIDASVSAQTTVLDPIYPVEQKVTGPVLRVIPAPLTQQAPAMPINPRYRTILAQAFPYVRRQPVTTTMDQSDPDAITLYDEPNNVILCTPATTEKPDVEWSDMYTLSILHGDTANDQIQHAIDSFVHGYNRRPVSAKTYKTPLLTPGYFTKVAGKQPDHVAQ